MIKRLVRFVKVNEKATCFKEASGLGMGGRGERIRTSGLYVPNVALYQAKLHPEVEPKIVANPMWDFRGVHPHSSGASLAMFLRT